MHWRSGRRATATGHRDASIGSHCAAHRHARARADGHRLVRTCAEGRSGALADRLAHACADRHPDAHRHAHTRADSHPDAHRHARANCYPVGNA